MTTPSSFSARTAAAARAAHLIVDKPPAIFADTLAARLLGEQAEELIAYHRAHGSHVVLAGARGQVTCRSRYAEDALAAAVDEGTAQHVILGAGLDSFAYRPGLASRVRTFEVDQRASQDDKRARLAAAAIPEPDNVVFVPVDFESASLAAELARAGLDLTTPAFVSWLGVTMYLTGEAIARTLAELGTLAPGSQVIADYMLPADLRDDAGATYLELVAAASAERGEPWLTFLSPQQLSDLLVRHGLGPVRHVGQRDIGDPQTWNRSDALRPVRLSLIGHAVVGG
ncbi:MAG TPA: SAM-dependent methyltransferase [Streptosporangiaceae bacterium]|nr:SAM-dependent methyltransferase [Streptosporangiaceae bacterium]